MSLANLIAKQKGIANVTPPPASTDGAATPGPNEPARADAAAYVESVEANDPPASPAKPAGFRIGGLKIGGATSKPEAQSVAGLSESVAKPTEIESAKPSGGNLASLTLSTSHSGGGTGVALDTLDAIANTELGAPLTIETPKLELPDLVDVQIPERELPADISMEGQGFVEQLNQIYSISYDPELFGQFIRMIMQELQEHPEYIKLMAPSDSHLMIRGLREVMGLAQIKKESTKRSTSRVAAAKKPTKQSEMDAILDGMGMDFGDDV